MSKDPSSPPPAAPVNTQSTLTLVVIAMLAIIAIMMFLNRNQSNTGSAKSSSNTEKLIALRESVSNKERELEAKGIALPADTGSIDELSKRISRDAMELRNTIETFQVALSNKESALSKAENDLKAVITTNQHLSTEASKLRSQLAQVQNAQSNLVHLQQEINSLKNTLLERDKEINNLSERPTAETVAQFRASLNETMLTNEKLNKKIGELEIQVINASNNSDMDKMRAENEQMSLELQKLRAASDYDSLYAKSAKDLRPEAAILHAELKLLEGLSPEQLKAAYMRIGQEHNAHMIRSVRFKTNSSNVGWNTLTGIKETITTAKKGSFFLVVGYASKTGDVAGNKVLSAKRSVTIASVVKHLKGSKDTRAVFLGQTERFSKQPLDNQICEIWELRK